MAVNTYVGAYRAKNAAGDYDFIDPAIFVTTGGTATALTASKTGVALVDGLQLRLKLHVNIGANATLNVNGTGAKPIKDSKGKGTKAGDKIAGSIMIATYNATLGSFFAEAAGGGLDRPDNYDDYHYVELTTSQTYTIPDGVEWFDVFCVGAGGPGNFSAGANVGGGGGGMTTTVSGVKVPISKQITAVIGAPIMPTLGNVANTYRAGKTFISEFAKATTAEGGMNGGRDSGGGGNGGSGGASTLYTDVPGADGENSSWDNETGRGKGQGRTTRAFGELEGKMYAYGGRMQFQGNYGQYAPGYVDRAGNGGDGRHLPSDTNYGRPGIVILRWPK